LIHFGRIISELDSFPTLSLYEIFSAYFPYFEKIEVGLCDQAGRKEATRKT
jgi:hypothetical protein